MVVSSVVKRIAIGAPGVGFNSLIGRIGHSVANGWLTAATFSFFEF